MSSIEGGYGKEVINRHLLEWRTPSGDFKEHYRSIFAKSHLSLIPQDVITTNEDPILIGRRTEQIQNAVDRLVKEDYKRTQLLPIVVIKNTIHPRENSIEPIRRMFLFCKDLDVRDSDKVYGDYLRRLLIFSNQNFDQHGIPRFPDYAYARKPVIYAP